MNSTPATRNRPARRAAGAILAGLLLLTAACSDDDESATTTEADAGSTTVPASGPGTDPAADDDHTQHVTATRGPRWRPGAER